MPEKLDFKKSLFAEPDAMRAGDAVLASNFSSFRSSRFAGDRQHPERVLNTYFRQSHLDPRASLKPAIC